MYIVDIPDFPIIDTRHARLRQGSQGMDGLGDDDAEPALLHMGNTSDADGWTGEGIVCLSSFWSPFPLKPQVIRPFSACSSAAFCYVGIYIVFYCDLVPDIPYTPYKLMGAEMLPDILGLILPFLEIHSTRYSKSGAELHYVQRRIRVFKGAFYAIGQ